MTLESISVHSDHIQIFAVKSLGAQFQTKMGKNFCKHLLPQTIWVGHNQTSKQKDSREKEIAEGVMSRRKEKNQE